MLKYLNMTKEQAREYTDFDSNILFGVYYSEEKTVLILNRELQ